VFEIAHKEFETITVAGHNPALMGKHPFKTNIPSSKDNSKEADKKHLSK
jgi:hypothetical protein